MRDMESYAAKGREHIPERYDLGICEAQQLFRLVKAKEGANGLWDALTTAFHAGCEAGMRAQKARMKQ